MAFPESCWAVLHDGDHSAIGHIALTFRIWYEDGAWQGKCEELKVPSFGDSPGETLNNVIDATICYLNEIESNGERERVFTEREILMLDGEPAENSVTESVASNEGVFGIDLGLLEAVA